MYPWTGSRMGVLVRASSQSESLYFNSMFLTLGGNPSACSTRHFISISICCRSSCKRIGSAEVVTTTCPGNVHAALKLQVALSSLIQLVQTKSESKPKLLSRSPRSYATEKGDRISPQRFHATNSRGQSPIVEVRTQKTHSNSNITVRVLLRDRTTTLHFFTITTNQCQN